VFVDIIRPPAGEAPDWVRQAWVGLRLPAAQRRARDWQGAGVITGPRSFAGQFWARLTGRTSPTYGYAVDAREAIDLLAGTNEAAAEWWRENAPRLLNDGQCFVFDATSCREAIGP
jgi:hypothetical protein